MRELALLQEQAEASWEENSLDGAPCALLKLLPTAGVFCSRDSETDGSHPFRSGTTCEPSTGDHGADMLTLCQVASHAKTSALPERDSALTENAPASGAKCGESFARYDPATHGWKIAQCSLFGDLDESSPTWPKWGLMRAGVCSELPMPALATNASALGCLPTLTASTGAKGGPNSRYGSGSMHLCSAVARLPTLTVHGNNNRKGAGASAKSGDGLATVVHKMPTLTAQDAKNNGGPSQMDRNTLPLNAEIGGPLNPEWCEWFMGWPIGWTELPRSATAKCRNKRLSHGSF